MSVPPTPPQQQRTITAEGLNLLYQEFGRAVHEKYEYLARALKAEQDAAQARQVVQAMQGAPQIAPDVLADLDASAASEPTPITKTGRGG